MLKITGDSYSKCVERIVTGSGISPLLRHSQDNSTTGAWLQIGVCALFVRRLWTTASTAVVDLLTPLKSYLYPLSTVPITTTTNFNKLIIVRS
jgi:hypothetical protein